MSRYLKYKDHEVALDEIGSYYIMNGSCRMCEIEFKDKKGEFLDTWVFWDTKGLKFGKDYYQDSAWHKTIYTDKARKSLEKAEKEMNKAYSLIDSYFESKKVYIDIEENQNKQRELKSKKGK